MNSHSRRLMAIAMAALISCYVNVPVRAAEKEKEEGTKFLRFVEEGQNGGRLETAIVTYKNDKGQTVQLIGAVHIADPGYYEALNKKFAGYDSLLYEMVKPKDVEMGGKGEKANGVGLVHILQKGMKYFLELDYQLDGIDYSAKNFVHADLTAEEFNKMQEERGESIWGMMLQQMMKEMLKGDNGKADQQMDPMALLEALQSPDSARHLKLILAKQFENMDEMVAGMEGPNGSVLVTERNKACLRVLKDQLAAGKKNLGIFYGAAHMKDMEKRMIDEMGFKKTGMEWRVAWDMSPKGAAKVGGAARNGDGGNVDDRDAKIDKLLEKIEQLEKKIDSIEKKK